MLLVELELWFGDERGYNATRHNGKVVALRLWFGDERGYNATSSLFSTSTLKLWFGDERGYNATLRGVYRCPAGCGLVMKEDITQQKM